MQQECGGVLRSITLVALMVKECNICPIQLETP